MNESQRAWELAMVLVASGKIPFDPANIGGSVKILARHLGALEEAMRNEVCFSRQAPPISGLQRDAKRAELALS